jgi:2-isopropylmalate synthase
MQTELAPLVQKASEESASEMGSDAIFEILKTNFIKSAEPVALQGFSIDRNESERFKAIVSIHGQECELNGQGEGVISAFLDGWASLTGQVVNVIDYSEHAVGKGTDALAAAYFLINVDGQRVVGMAFDTDSLGASLKALISALNRSEVTVSVAA